MARTTILVSDISGEQIPEGEYVHVAITEGATRYDVDAIRSEIQELIEKGRKSKRRGRKAKAAA
jgi:hypothetical protein